ncbi:MAG: hypothetical protein GSR85_00770 [Desulfurococcales archaeon]|nr:hypothetical protein [Desulfurococcales archaeon]
MYVIGVPPGNYTVAITGLEANQTIEYDGALHAYIQYDAARDNGYPQLIPGNTLIKIVIKPLGPTITVLVKK